MCIVHGVRDGGRGEDGVGDKGGMTGVVGVRGPGGVLMGVKLLLLVRGWYEIFLFSNYIGAAKAKVGIRKKIGSESLHNLVNRCDHCSGCVTTPTSPLEK